MSDSQVLDLSILHRVGFADPMYDNSREPSPSHTKAHISKDDLSKEG